MQCACTCTNKGASTDVRCRVAAKPLAIYLSRTSPLTGGDLPVAYRKFQYVIIGAQIFEHNAFSASSERYRSHFFAAGWARRANGRDVILVS